MKKPGKKTTAALAVLGIAAASVIWHDAPYILQCPSPFSPLSYKHIHPAGAQRYMVQRPSDGLWGMIDQQGREIIAPRYAHTDHNSVDKNAFADNRYPVGNADYQWGYIDRDGHEIIPLQYDGAQKFSNGLAPVATRTTKDGKVSTHFTLINPDGEKIMPANAKTWITHDRFIGITDGQSVMMDANGAILSAPYGQISHVGKTGIFTVRNHDLYGLIDHAGREIVPAQYENITIHNNGAHYIVKQNGHHGVLDANGNTLIPIHYEDIILADNARFIALKNRQWHIRDMQENIIADLPHHISPDWRRGDLILITQNHLFGLADWQGNLIQPPEYDAIYPLHDQRIAFRQNGKIGYFDDKGQIIIPAQYQPREDNSANHFASGLAAVNTGQHWQIIDRNGAVLADKLHYANVYNFDEKGRAPAERQKWFGRWGEKEHVVIDRQGNTLPRHAWADYNEDGLAAVQIAPNLVGKSQQGIPYFLRARPIASYLMQENGCLLPKPKG